MEAICYWADGTWCSQDELEEYHWMSDDYTTIYVEDTDEYEDIQILINQKLGV